MDKFHQNFYEFFYRTLAKEFTKKYWGVELTCPIEFVNRKWRSMLGYFMVNTETNECKIVLNHKVNEKRTIAEVLTTLKHELVHWYLWSIGKPYNDDDEEFIRECLRIGASISQTKSAQEALRRYREKEKELVELE